jgi:copper chaperone NosL
LNTFGRCRLVPVLIGALALPVWAQPPAPSKTDKCPVCGMFVAKYQDWIGVLLFPSGAPLYADGAKDLFRAFQDLRKYAPGRGEVVSIHVKDYYQLGWIDGRKAFYVLGSDVFGPMGKELVPFALEADAKAFLQEHHGTRLLRFAEITPELLRSLE